MAAPVNEGIGGRLLERTGAACRAVWLYDGGWGDGVERAGVRPWELDKGREERSLWNVERYQRQGCPICVERQMAHPTTHSNL